MFSFGVKVILLLVLVSGAVAYLGDYVGWRIGKKRLTLLGLRPRYTAIAITVLTGVLIALTTLGTLLIISQDARTALFGLKELESNLAQTKAELQQKSIEKEKIDQQLAGASQDLVALRKNIETTRQGTVLFKVGDVIITSLIQAGPEQDKLELGLNEIILATTDYDLNISPREMKRAVNVLAGRLGENIVQVVALRKTLAGETIPAKLVLLENVLVYQAGQVIASLTIPTGLTAPQTEQAIKKLLADTNSAAIQNGVLPDLTGAVGSLPYAEIYNLAKKIQTSRKAVLLQTVAQSDTYRIGPLQITFKINNK